MIAAEIIGQVLDAGGQIAVDGGDLVLTAPRPLPADLLDTLKAHKPAILAALAAPAVTEESVDADRQGWGAMTTAALLQAAEAAGMAIRVDGDALAYEIYSGGPPDPVERDSWSEGGDPGARQCLGSRGAHRDPCRLDPRCPREGCY